MAGGEALMTLKSPTNTHLLGFPLSHANVELIRLKVVLPTDIYGELMRILKP